MVPSKKSPRRAPREKTADKSQKGEVSALRRWLSREGSVAGGKLVLRDYVIMNAVFAAVCLVQLIIVRLLLRDFAGLYFFFGFIMCAFLLASIFDYFSEKLDMGVASAGENTDLTND